MKPPFYYNIIEIFCNIGKKWDSLSPKEKDAIEFAHKNINPEPIKKITGFSPEYYLAHYGEVINTRFRNNKIDEDDKKTIKMVAKHKAKVPLVLYRGVHKNIFDQMKENAKNMKDTDLYEKAFLQTSLVKNHERYSKDYSLRIFVPAGTQAVYLGNVNDEQFNYEVVIQHGAKLKILSKDKKYYNCKLIETYCEENVNDNEI